jgi:hypothetical protein
MSTETVIVDGTPTPVDIKSLTMLFHKGDVDIKAPDRLEIGPEQTLHRCLELDHNEIAKCARDPIFVHLYRLILGEKAVVPDTIADLSRGSLGQRHVFGMLVMIQDATREGKKIFLRQPEAFLHPSQQVGLADLLIMLLDRPEPPVDESRGVGEW